MMKISTLLINTAFLLTILLPVVGHSTLAALLEVAKAPTFHSLLANNADEETSVGLANSTQNADAMWQNVSGNSHSYSDNEWTSMSSGTTAGLYGVWGNSGSDVFAVGDYGTILHYNGNSWNAMNSGTNNSLRDVWGSGVNNIFAVGQNGTILYYNGNSWSTMNSGTNKPLNGVWGNRSNNVFAVGGDWYGSILLHYDGSSWKTMISGTSKALYGIWGTSDNDIFAVGDAGIIIHYNGSKWSIMNSGTSEPIHAVYGNSSNKVFAACGSRAYGVVLHYNGSIWSKMYIDMAPTLSGIWSNDNNAFAVGEYGHVYQYDGSTWISMNSGSTDWLNGVWGSGPVDVFVVGTGGTILHHGSGSVATSVASLTLLTTPTIPSSHQLDATAQVYNTGTTQQEFELTFSLWQDSITLETQTFGLYIDSGITADQAANFGLRPVGRYRVEAKLSANGATLTTLTRDILVVDPNAARIILDYADDLRAAAHAELDDIAYIPSWALSDEILSFGLDELENYAIGKFADLAAPIQEAGNIPLTTSDDAITQMQDKLGRARLYRQNLAATVRLYVNDMYGVTLPNGFDPLNPDLDFINDPILKDRIKNWLTGYLATFFSDKIISPLWINGPRNIVDDRHIAFENFLLLHPISEEPPSLAGQMQRGQNRIRNVVEGDSVVTLGPYDVLGHTLRYDLTLQEQENKRQQIDEFGDILKIAIAVLVVIGVVIILLLIVGAISSGGVLAAVVGPIIWKIVKVLFTIGKKIVPIARALLVASMLFTVSIIAPHIPQYHDETLDAAEALVTGSGKVLLRTFNVTVQSERVRLTAQVDGPETDESQVLVETALYSVDGRIINIVWSALEIQAGQQATLNKDVSLAPGTYRAVTTLYAEGDVAAVKTSPFQVTGLEVKLDLRLSQSHLDLGDSVEATVILTNTSIISDVNDLTLFLESSDGTNFDAWPVSLAAGETQQIDYTFTPTMTEACVLRAWLGVGFNTVAQQDAAYIVGAGPAVALNTNFSDVYTPGLTVTLPLTLTNVGDTATTVAVTVQTMDRLQTGIVIFSSTLTATVPPSDTTPAMAIALPDAQPGLYSAWLTLNGTAYDAWDFAVAATDTLFGLLTVGELYVDVGQSVPVTATISSANDTLTDATITVTIQSPGQTITTLPMTWVDNGTYRTDFTPAISGTYSLELAAARANYRTVGDQSFFIAEMSTLLIPAIKGQPQVGEIHPVSVTVNSETGIPISGATVILSGTEEILRSETDETGCVVLQTFPPDVRAYVLTTERMGYAGATTEVAVGWFQVYLPLVLRNH